MPANNRRNTAMRISRLTLSTKLGIQMYDRVSAVLAELIANAYDADARERERHVAFGQYLARRQRQGQLEIKDSQIIIEDDGMA